MRKSKSTIENNQIPYFVRQDHPQFYGMRRNDSNLLARENKFDVGTDTNSNASRSLSDIWELESKKSVPDFTVNAAVVSNRKLDKDDFLDNDDGDNDDDADDDDYEEEKDEEGNKKLATEKKIFQNEDKKKNGLPRISSYQSAASYYIGNSQGTEVSTLQLCESIDKLNQYLKSRKADLRAGVPGKYLHVVLGPEVADIGSVISTIMYAFFLNETQKSSSLCVVPIINMKRGDLSMHNVIKWLLHSCRVDESCLVFIDEIDLSYYDLFGNLKIVLVDRQKLAAKQEKLKEALIEIFFCKQVDAQYPSVEKITMGEDCSCCTLLAEKFAETTPEILAGQGFSRLLLSGIILDTENLTDANCTSKDKYMATLLIKGAGRYGFKGFYQLLKQKMFDISELKVRDILRKDIKKWTRVAGKPNSASRLTVSRIGMSSIGISIEQLLAREDSAAEEVVLFQKMEKLQLLMIVSGYYDSQKNFKREILVSTKTAELMRTFLHFFDTSGTHLPLKTLDQQDLGDGLKAFEIMNKLTSRRSIERLLEEFSGVLKQQ